LFHLPVNNIIIGLGKKSKRDIMRGGEMENKEKKFILTKRKREKEKNEKVRWRDGEMENKEIKRQY